MATLTKHSKIAQKNVPVLKHTIHKYMLGNRPGKKAKRKVREMS